MGQFVVWEVTLTRPNERPKPVVIRRVASRYGRCQCVQHHGGWWVSRRQTTIHDEGPREGISQPNRILHPHRRVAASASDGERGPVLLQRVLGRQEPQMAT